jgi:hypothetical protein
VCPEKEVKMLSHYLTFYRDLFVSRKDDHAVQLTNGRYRRVGCSLQMLDVSDHLLGVRTYGTYVIDEQGLCRFAVIDADTPDGLERLATLQEQFAREGKRSYLEVSRRGGHLWFFFSQPAPAWAVRAWLLPHCPTDMELYPKQDAGRGVGSLIRLPLGVHRLSGKRYAFVERAACGVLAPVSTTLEDTLSWLTTVERVDLPIQDDENRHTPTHTSFSFFSVPATRPHIREWNAQQDPFQLIGRYVDLNTQGVGRCPFGWHHKGQDQHASFKVYQPGVPGGYCWYCYTWQQGGSVFDFLRYYYNVDGRTLWQRLQSGTSQF